MAQQNPFIDSAESHRGIVTRTAWVSLGLVLLAMIGFPTLIAPHLSEPVVVSMASPRAPVAADQYLSTGEVLSGSLWWLVPFVIFFAVFVHGLLTGRTGRMLAGAVGTAAFGCICAGRLVGIAVTNTTDLSPALQPAFCLVLYIAVSSPFLMALIQDMGKKNKKKTTI